MKRVARKPILPIEPAPLIEAGIDPREFEIYFPKYLRKCSVFYFHPLGYAGQQIFQLLVRFSIKLFLRPRRNRSDTLGIREVQDLYDQEAAKYDSKHHFTTHGMDTTWRRMAAWCALGIARDSKAQVNVLDICTGTGLTVKEMLSVFSDWGIKARITGLDYNEKMLDIAQSRNLNHPSTDVQFVRGDAMDLTTKERLVGEEFARFDLNTFHAVSQVFGIGGISEPQKRLPACLRFSSPGAVIS